MSGESMFSRHALNCRVAGMLFSIGSSAERFDDRAVFAVDLARRTGDFARDGLAHVTAARGKREYGEVYPSGPDAVAAPATVSGEWPSGYPLAQAAGKDEGPRRTASQETCHHRETLCRAGCLGWEIAMLDPKLSPSVMRSRSNRQRRPAQRAGRQP